MPRHGPAAAPDLDRAFLEELSAGDRAFEAEILSVFVDSAAQSAASLREGVAGDAWRDNAHKLKGAAEAVGARHLAELAGAAITIPRSSAAERARLLAEIDAAVAVLQDICAA